MSIELMTKVWKEADAEGSKLLLLLALADMANDDGYCWPSYDTLAKKARISRTHTINLMKELIESGWVHKEKRYRKGQPTEQTSNGYWIVLPNTQLTDLTTQLTEVIPPSQAQLTPQLTPLNPPQLTGVNPNHHIEPPIKSSINTPVVEADTSLPAVSNIFKMYESEIGALTGFVADELKDAQKTYPDEWIVEAIKESARMNKRSWKYALAILKRWKVEGINPLPEKPVKEPKLIETRDEKGQLIFVRAEQ